MVRFEIRWLHVLFAVLICGTIHAGIIPGAITDSVPCRNLPGYSYALYLPPAYQPATKWPVIFVFDPGSNSKDALEHFTDAAEQYGYILVCSNNSRNGLPAEELDKITGDLFEEIAGLYAIDNNRIYAAGFSGGSRLASMLAIGDSRISGVIACGAGFPASTETMPGHHFGYFGLVGNCDMNYIEMQDLTRQLDSLGFCTVLRTFDGGHAWPSPDLIREAVDWMELQAQGKSPGANFNRFADSLFTLKHQQTILLMQQGNIQGALENLNFMINWLAGDRKSELERTADSLQKTDQYLKTVDKTEKARAEELKLRKELFSKLKEIAHYPEGMPDSIHNAWLNQINGFRKLAAGKNPYRSAMACRLLCFLSIQGFETADYFVDFKQYRTAFDYYEITAMVYPESSYVLYIMARTLAQDMSMKAALKYLDDAVEKGFNDRYSVMHEPAFIPLRENAKFREIAGKMRP
jgi:predicted esterase